MVQARPAVKVIQSKNAIKLLADSTRREVLRQLGVKPQTVTQLADKMHLTKSTIGHHISTLLKAKLIRIKLVKPGSHGILEKYYESTAVLLVENYEKIPPELRKDFLNIHIDWLRGVFSAFQLIGGTSDTTQLIREPPKWEGVAPDFDLLHELAKEVAKQMSLLGKKYEGSETELDGEALRIRMYSEVLKSMITQDLWRKIFESFGEINTLHLNNKQKP